MTEQPPAATTPAPAPEDPLPGIAAVGLRLLAGAVSKKTLEALKRTVLASPAEYPWQVVNRVILAEPVPDADLVQKGLRAERDWILRGGREQPGKPVSVRAKTLLAKVLVQSLFLAIHTAVVVVVLLLLKHKWPDVDVYAILRWLYDLFPGAAPAGVSPK